MTGIGTELCRGFSLCSFVSVGMYVKMDHDHFMPHSVQSLITARRGMVSEMDVDLNPLNTKRRLLYLKTHFVPRSKHFSSRLYTVYAVSGTSRCLFSDKYKTHKYSVGRTYNS